MSTTSTARHRWQDRKLRVPRTSKDHTWREVRALLKTSDRELEEVTGMPKESLEPELSKLEFGGAPMA